ncbi:MAG: extracellular solute-binding protein [Hyphomonas sp.]|nr:extracellular solute-binding protein [Hyphomonas sp.]
MTGYLGEQVEIVCDRFNEAQEDYEVVCTGRGGYAEAMQSAIAAYRAGEQPAIVQVTANDTLTLMLSDAFYPAHQLLADHGYDVEAMGFFDAVVENFASSQGDLYGMPFNISTPVMYYNTAMFRDAGIETPPETWQQFEDAMRALQASGVECPYAESPHAWVHLTQLHAMHNAPVATNNNGFDGLDTRYALETLQSKHLSLLKRMYDEGLMHIYGPLMGQSAGISAREAFASGRCAVNTSSIAGHATVTSLADDDLEWAVAFMPVHDDYERHNSYVGGGALWAFNGHSEDVYAGAAAFLDFLASTESQRHWATVTGYMPLTSGAYEALVDENFYAQPNYAGREVAIESINFGDGPTPLSRGIRVGNMSQMQAIWKEEMDRILVDEQDVEAGVLSMIRRGNLLLEQFEQLHSGAELP